MPPTSHFCPQRRGTKGFFFSTHTAPLVLARAQMRTVRMVTHSWLPSYGSLLPH
uniref:Uncharacterized protein n=1 Tax=Anguilla anguilla TaxID=7936 RepID=A0A0E9UZT8_ANGAN